MLLIRLDCKFEEEEGGGISLTTDNILHYLGIIEERTLEIISSYERGKKSGNSDDPHQTNSSNSFGKDLPLSTYHGHGSGLKARPIGGSTEQALMINPPRLLDYSSDDESADDEGCDSSLKPL